MEYLCILQICPNIGLCSNLCKNEEHNVQNLYYNFVKITACFSVNIAKISSLFVNKSCPFSHPSAIELSKHRIWSKNFISFIESSAFYTEHGMYSGDNVGIISHCIRKRDRIYIKPPHMHCSRAQLRTAFQLTVYQKHKFVVCQCLGAH